MKLNLLTNAIVVDDAIRFVAENWSQDMRILPVNFNLEHKAMLAHCKMLLEADGGGRVAINPDRFDKLITLPRTAIDYDGILDKESISS